MPDLRDTARRLVKALASDRPKDGRPGAPALMTGLEVVTEIERRADAVLTSEHEPGGGGGRSRIATALGRVIHGTRASVIVDEGDLEGATDLVRRVSDLRAPLVVFLLGGRRATAETVAAEAGWVVLAADSVQAAADLTLVARRVAERALRPVLLRLDPESAWGPASLAIPGPDAIMAVVGPAGESLHPPTASQSMEHGRHRLRIPRRFDRERPAMLGAALPEDSGATVAAADEELDRSPLRTLLWEAFETVASVTGRSIPPLVLERHRRDELVLVATGSSVAVAVSAVRRLRSRGTRVGLVGLRQLHPWPTASLLENLLGVDRIAVLERSPVGPDRSGPVASALRSAFAKSIENRRAGASVHPEVPALPERRLPLVTSVAWGVDDQPLRGADAEALVRALTERFRPSIWLGVSPLDATDDEPKRRARQDQIVGAWPAAAELGLRGERSESSAPEEGTTTILVRSAGNQMARSVASFLHDLGHPHVLCRPGSDRPFPELAIHRVVTSSEPIVDHGTDQLGDVLLWLGAGPPTRPGDLDVLRNDGTIMIALDPATDTDGIAAGLSKAVRREIVERDLRLVVGPSATVALDRRRNDVALGTVVGHLEAEGEISASPRKLLETFGRVGDGSPEATHAFQAGIERRRLVTVAPEPATQPPSPDLPPVVRTTIGHRRDLDDLPAFWDQIGSLAHRDELDRLAPDPFLSTRSLPARTAAFGAVSHGRTHRPSLDPALCTGCGACWTACPDGAIVGSVFTSTDLLELGMSRAKAAGYPPDALRMVTSKLARRIAVELEEPRGEAAGPAMSRAFEAVMAGTKLPDDRRDAVTEAFEAVRDAVGTIDLVRTSLFFDRPEAAKRGGGRLLTLVTDTSACKACGLCVAECEPRALLDRAETPERRRTDAARRDLVADLSVDGGALDQVRDEIGPLTADLLRPSARHSLVGGDGSEPGSGSRLAVRQVLGAASARLESRCEVLLERLATTRQRLGDAIHTALARALPDSDLAALADGLAALSRPDADLRELTERVESAVASDRVDAPRVQRLVTAAQELADLTWRVESGAGGLGRAPVGVVVGPGRATRWLSEFPANPFSVPVVADATADAAAIAIGLAASELDDAVDLSRALRRADGELDAPSRHQQRERELAQLGPDGLDPVERALAGPVVIVLDETTLAGPAIAGLLGALDGDLPIKVVLLAGDPLAFQTPIPIDIELLGLACPAAWIVQSTIAHPSHLAHGLQAALESPGPAVLRLLAPSPRDHGFDPDQTLDRARAAVETRAFPLLVSKPWRGRAAIEVDLDGNPERGSTWPAGRTPIDWALGESRWAGELEEVAADTVGSSAAHGTIGATDGDLPALVTTSDGGVRRPSDRLVRAVERRREVWIALQTLAAGDRAHVAAATAEAESQLRASLTAAHTCESDALRAHYEHRLAAVRDQVWWETAVAVRNRLVEVGLAAAGDHRDHDSSRGEP